MSVSTKTISKDRTEDWCRACIITVARSEIRDRLKRDTKPHFKPFASMCGKGSVLKEEVRKKAVEKGIEPPPPDPKRYDPESRCDYFDTDDKRDLFPLFEEAAREMLPSLWEHVDACCLARPLNHEELLQAVYDADSCQEWYECWREANRVFLHNDSVSEPEESWPNLIDAFLELTDQE